MSAENFIWPAQHALSRGKVRMVRNPQSKRSGLERIDWASYNPQLSAQARRHLRLWPEYRPTRLINLDRLASTLGVDRVVAKFEGDRTELASFKALGGAYAVGVVLARELERQGVAPRITVSDLEQGLYRTQAAEVTVVCASDGNHGRSVAWGARRFGCRAQIYLPEAVSPFRGDAIEKLGACVSRVDGNYDDAVRKAANDAALYGWIVVSDTATPDYLDVPAIVTAGYSLMLEEAMDQLGADAPPTHVIVQVGCGGLAAVVAGYLLERFGAGRPQIVTVEPLTAACLMESLTTGRPSVIEGEHQTRMGGLACGELSFTSWPILQRSVDVALAMNDDFAVEAVRRLHGGDLGAAIDCGESGAAGTGVLLAAALDPELRSALDLQPDSRVLLFITEGVTDPDEFGAIMTGLALDQFE